MLLKTHATEQTNIPGCIPEIIKEKYRVKQLLFGFKEPLTAGTNRAEAILKVETAGNAKGCGMH